MDTFAEILTGCFGVNEPILTEEIKDTFPDVTEKTVFNWIDEAMGREELRKYQRGVYYIPDKNDPYGLGERKLSPYKVIQKKYLGSNDEVFGYISGLNLENQTGVSPQVPATLEITTNKAAKRVREIQPFGGWRAITLRSPRTEVTSENLDALRFLDLITRVPLRSLEKNELDSLTKLSNEADRDTILECVKFYPDKTAKRLVESGAYGVFA